MVGEKLRDRRRMVGDPAATGKPYAPRVVARMLRERAPWAALLPGKSNTARDAPRWPLRLPGEEGERVLA
jgi:hypothetical protein